eukprot:TRINITY_DN8813_c0_g3_i2.p3 TRINITY_DN8813_c0_g3~~TRINITY_DN8813_c0_g3_i2.p3  ORF type:complete len:108 (-),score=16.80 TRINITY_DN8813_c0_g3_i2:62-385(-)
MNKHRDPIEGACFSKNGLFILSGSTDSITTIWDARPLQQGIPLSSLPSEPHVLQPLCSFSCSGRICSLDATILNDRLYFSCGEGSGVLYILSPVGFDIFGKGRKKKR